VVLGAPALEEPAGVSRWWGRGPTLLGAILLALAAALPPGVARAVGEDPVAEVAEALRSLGPPGALWGRLAIEEESPAGAWTPLGGVEVTLYPATPALIAELERIRQSARGSGAQYESAVARVKAAFAAHQAQVNAHSTGTFLATDDSLAKEDSPAAESPAPDPARAVSPKASDTRPRARIERPGDGATKSGPSEEPPSRHPWRQRTDPAGLFAFDPLPSGDWLVVAIRVSPYGTEKLRGEPRPRQPRRGQRFLLPAAAPAKEAELWVVRARVGAAERVGLELTDRARWLAGPIR